MARYSGASVAVFHRLPFSFSTGVLNTCRVKEKIAQVWGIANG
jgi:hypothetical protein